MKLEKYVLVRKGKKGKIRYAVDSQILIALVFFCWLIPFFIIGTAIYESFFGSTFYMKDVDYHKKKIEDLKNE